MTTTSTLVAAATPPRPPRAGGVTKALLVSGIVAGPVFVLAFIGQGVTRDGYDALRHPVSSLAIGVHGWMQTANFVVCGLLTLAFAVGVRRVVRPGRAAVWGPLLIGVWAVGMIGSGAFLADPVNGFPPGTPDVPARATTSGAVHDAFALVGFPALLVACFVFAWRFTGERRRGWAVYSALTGVVFLAFDILATAGFAQADGLVSIAGLLQRVTIGAALLWLTLLAVHLRRRV